LSDDSTRNRFGTLLDSAGQMFWEVNKDFTVVFANDRLKRVFGDPVGRSCHEFMAGTSQVCADCPVQRIFGGEERAVSERMRHDAQGRPIWLEHTAVPIRDEGGEIVGVSELTIDITHRKQTEEWLRDSERLYRNLVDQVPDVIFSLDSHGRFTFVNPQVEKFLGYSVGEILETPLENYVASEDRERLESLVMLESDAIWDEEIAMEDSEGNRRFARIRCKASRDVLGQPLGFEGVMRDRTIRRQLEEDLKSSREELVRKIRIIDELYEHIVHTGKCKAIQEHTAEVAHELRQPLAIVGGFARRLAKQAESEEPVDSARQKQYTSIIIAEIQRLEKILDGLIDFTKREHIRRQTANPNDLIQYILGITEGRRREKNITIKSDFGLEVGDIPLDPGRFQQLVLNLVSNAIEASPSGGTIEIETGSSFPSDKALKAGKLESQGFFEMKIRNNGPEITSDTLQKIFNPFFTTKKHGTGLGLTVSKKIVEDHMGTVSVKSDYDGTVFTVWLPLIDRLIDSDEFDAQSIIEEFRSDVPPSP
jgi:PAS domain S-box-containing protein